MQESQGGVPSSPPPTPTLLGTPKGVISLFYRLEGEAWTANNRRARKGTHRVRFSSLPSPGSSFGHDGPMCPSALFCLLRSLAGLNSITQVLRLQVCITMPITLYNKCTEEQVVFLISSC